MFDIRRRIQQDAGGLGHIQSHEILINILFCSRMACEVRRAATTTTLPGAGGRARTTRATRPSARQRRRRHLHRHPRERHVLRPGVQRRVRAEGVTSCTDRVLTEVAVCIPDVTTRAELKAAVDACVGDRLCELTMPHWDVSQRDGHELPVPGQVTVQRGHQPVGDVAGDGLRGYV